MMIAIAPQQRIPGSSMRLLLCIAAFFAPCYYAMNSQLSISDTTTNFKCQITISNTFYTSGTHGQEVACIYQKDYMWAIDDFPMDLYNAYLAEIAQGTLWVKISYAYLSDSRIITNKYTKFKVMASNSPSVFSRTMATPGVNTSLATPAIGNKTLFILRVATNDSVPTYNLDQLQQHIMGSSNDTSSPSLRGQYYACSFGQLNFVYAGGQTVYIDAPVASFASAAALGDAAIYKLSVLRNIALASDIADKMMIIMPPGTAGAWLSNAGVNYWRSTFNDKWGMSLSANMHEMGHNLGFLHSGEGTVDPDLTYGDRTGYMVSRGIFDFARA
jgi:hypothetical protein